MKLKGDKVFHHPVGIYPQSFSHDNVVEVVGLKSGDEVAYGKHEDLSESTTIGIDEYWSEAGSTCSDHGEDCAVKIRTEIEQCDHYSSKDFVEVTDKNMMDGEEAKMIVCCKDNTACLKVKDICIDEGVTSNVHISSEKEKGKVSSTAEEISIDDIADKRETNTPSLEVSEAFEVQTREDLTSLNLHKDLMEANVGDASSEAISDESTGRTTIGSIVNDQESVATVTALNDGLGDTNLLAKDTAENGSVAIDVDAPATSPSFKDETSMDRSSANPVNVDNSKADAASNWHLESLEDRRDHRQSSFSYTGPVPISGSVTYSGPVAFSGSLSLRSDSSTTSTRSFAFPILQNEWNGSPVRMAKGNRGRLQKNKDWRCGLLCCRF